MAVEQDSAQERAGPVGALGPRVRQHAHRSQTITAEQVERYARRGWWFGKEGPARLAPFRSPRR